MVVFIIALNIAFTLKVLQVVETSGVEPSTLIVSWFAFTTGELWMLASIKKTKAKQEAGEEILCEEEEVQP